MKFILAIAVLFSFIFLCRTVSANSEEDLEIVKGVIEECQTKIGTPDVTLDKLILGEFDEGGADKVAMCHVNCMMEELGTLKNGNAEKFESLKAHIDDEEAKKHLEQCQLETGEDECETGYKVYMCLKANAEKIFRAE